MLDGDTRERILIEVSLGVKAPAHESAEAREFRRKITREVEAIVEQGGGIDVPGEIP
jgi:hypothetical protein